MSYYTRDLIINGTLIAEGTNLDNINFYSTSSTGGGSLVLADGSSGHNLQYCSFDNLGNEPGGTNSSNYDTGLYIADTSPTVDHCSFNNCGTGGGLHIRARATSLENLGPSNDLYRAYILNNTLDNTSLWPNIDTSGFEYVITADQNLPAGETLTIEPGITINLSYYDRDLIIYGTLIAEGTPSENITIYSSSSLGGGSLVLADNSSGHRVLNCTFNNLGNEGGSSNASYYDTGLYIGDTSPLVDNCTFINCGTGGVQHIRARATALENFGSYNDVYRIYILNNTLDLSLIHI